MSYSSNYYAAMDYGVTEHKRWWEISRMEPRRVFYRFAFHKYPDFDKQLRMAIAMGAPGDVLRGIIHPHVEKWRTK